MILLPGVLAGALSGGAAALAATPPALLAAGLWRRSDALLLLGFPASLSAAAAAAPVVVSSHAYDPVRFAAIAASLAGYLLAASARGAGRSRPRAGRPLPMTAMSAPRWRRRFRVYSGLAALSAIFPLALMYAVHFDAGNRAYVGAMYAGRSEAVTTALAALAVVAWAGVFAYAFSGPLFAHRKGDRALRAELGERKSGSAAGGGRSGLYLGIATAVVLGALLVALRLP